MAGVASADSDTASAGGEEDKATDGDPLATAIATVRATLERVSALVDANEDAVVKELPSLISKIVEKINAGTDGLQK